MEWESVASETPVCILMRHAERFHIPVGSVGTDVPLTEKGRQDSRAWGRLYGGWVRKICASPISRCVDTAKCIAEGAGLGREVSLCTELGAPGPFVTDGQLAWQNWIRLGGAEVNRRLMTTQECLPGMVIPLQGARRLVDFMQKTADGRSGIHVFVTHDNILAITIAQLVGVVAEYEGVGWPAFLEASAWWYKGTKLYCEWSRQVFELTPW